VPILPSDISRQERMDLRDDGSPLTDGGGYPFGGASAYVSNGKNARATRLERQALAVTDAVSCKNEALSIDRDTAVEPAGVRIGADEQKEVARGTFLGLPGLDVTEYGTGQTCLSIAMQANNLNTHMEFDIGQCRDPVDQILGHGLLERSPDHEMQSSICGER